MPFEPWDYLIGALAALLVGLSKTGLPGAGILAVPLMVAAFGGRLSIGALLPLLIVADVFAVVFYRAHARWDHLRVLAPWVLAGLLAGTALLKLLGDLRLKADPLSPLIGVIVLGMLALTVLRGRLGERLRPHSPAGTAFTGMLGGLTTLVSNAAGPVMAIYLTAAGLGKRELMGTTAWFFLLLNIAKLPLLVLLTLDNPAEPLLTAATLAFDVAMLPVLVAGVYAGRWLLHRLPELAFARAVLVLAALAALKLMAG